MVIELQDSILTGISERDIRIEIALSLYRQERISLGKAAQLAGLHRFEFQLELEKRGLDFTYQIDDLERELVNLAN